METAKFSSSFFEALYSRFQFPRCENYHFSFRQNAIFLSGFAKRKIVMFAAGRIDDQLAEKRINQYLCRANLGAAPIWDRAPCSTMGKTSA
jgi:hypothetical protein